MQLTEFFDRVLPSAGEKFFGASVDKSKPNSFTEAQFNSKSALLSYVEKNKAKEADLYFATGSYDGQRKTEKTQFKRAFYLDVDCGDGKGYATKADALADLKRLCKDTSLPMPTIIVDTGNGFHLYWSLDRDISGAQWKLDANALKMFCATHQFKCDPVSTADAARILRVPESLNCKDPTNTKLVRILRGDGVPDVNYDLFRAALGMMPSKLTGTLGTFVTGDEIEANVSWSKTPYYRADVMVQRCEIFKESLRTGGVGQVEGLWKDQLEVLAYTVDGDDFVHKISEKYAGYTLNETNVKFQEQRNKVSRVGPTGCKTFEGYRPDLCQKCQYYNIYKSPLLLGTPINENKPPQEFKLYPNKVTTIIVDDKGQSHEFPICDFGIQDFNLSKADDHELMVRFQAMVAARAKSVKLLVSELADKKILIARLSLYGVVIQDAQYKGFRDFMTSWIKQMQEARREIPTYTHMGWVRDGDKIGFALGNKVIWAGESDTENALEEASITAQFSPTGSADEWLSIAHEITGQNKPAINCIIGTSFAAPLLQLVGQDGFFMSFSSAASGSGKTTALRIAQSVWGDPVRGISMLDDTPLSVVKRLGYLHNLPAYWDEVRVQNNAGPFVNMMFQLTLGKERSRLASNTKLQDMGTWATMLVIATNDSIVDHVRAETKSTDAGRARVFEVEVSELDKPDYALADRIAKLKYNYGHAGETYARFLVAHSEQVTKSLRQTTETLTTKLSPKPAERFWLAGVAAVLVGSTYANKLGLTKIDLSALTRWLIDQIKRQRDSMTADFKTAPAHAVDYVWEYCDEFRDQLVVVDHLTGRGLSAAGRVYVTPDRGRVLGTYAVKDRTVRIGRQHFVDWLYKRGIAPSQVVDTLTRENKAKETLSRVAVGMPNMVAQRVRALDVRGVNDDLAKEIINGAEHYALPEKDD